MSVSRKSLSLFSEEAHNEDRKGKRRVSGELLFQQRQESGSRRLPGNSRVYGGLVALHLLVEVGVHHLIARRHRSSKRVHAVVVRRHIARRVCRHWVGPFAGRGRRSVSIAILKEFFLIISERTVAAIKKFCWVLHLISWEIYSLYQTSWNAIGGTTRALPRFCRNSSLSILICSAFQQEKSFSSDAQPFGHCSANR